MTKKEMIKRKQRKEFWEFADLTDARVLDLAKAEITPLSKEEVFVQVKGSQNYWISNYGRWLIISGNTFTCTRQGMSTIR